MQGVKTKKAVLSGAIILLALAGLLLFIFSYVARQSRDFPTALSAIYQAYDENIDSADSANPYALKRLIVSDYHGHKTYGAVATAVDKAHHFAVLQYNSEADAKRAYEAILADGFCVDTDSVAVLTEDKGEVCPEASGLLGTGGFLSDYQMDADEITVAVIDTGMMYDHELLRGRMLSRGYDFSEDGCKDAYYDTEQRGQYYDHATFVGGIIADNTGDNVLLLPYKTVAFGASYAPASAIISAINDATDKGASVINISLTSFNSANAFATAVKNAVNKGVCICASAGNDSAEMQQIYPAMTPGVITVSAIDKDKNFTVFSNYGEEIDFCAPGYRVVSSYPDEKGSSGYKAKSGTSFSSPYVAAVCADVKSMNRQLSKDEVCRLLRDFAEDLGDEGFDDYFGYGLPRLNHIVYTDGENYRYALPQGTLEIYQAADYTAQTQPWRLFAHRLVSVSVDSSLTRIGNYTFCGVSSAAFSLGARYDVIGDYAFYGCRQLTSFTFDSEVTSIGTDAFGGIDDFTVNGYRNTPAETYALRENKHFNSLGCKHNYLVEFAQPTATQDGYSVFTCAVCGDSYTDAYFVPTVVDSGACGTDLTYTLYDTGQLMISGTGAMTDYRNEAAPWRAQCENIKTLYISDGVTAISPFAFYGCRNLIKIKLGDENTAFSETAGDLYSADGTTLILAAAAGGVPYTMPTALTNLEATAFICAQNRAISVNEHFTMTDGLLYDEAGSLVYATPAFTARQWTADGEKRICRYAFLFSAYPSQLNIETEDTVFEDYAVGYYYDGAVQQRDMTVKTYPYTTAYHYAQDNGFAVQSFNSGTCGNSMSWEYDLTTNTLTLSGKGEMTYCDSVERVPWAMYLSRMVSVTIADGVTYLSDYAFYGATRLTTLVMPLSVAAPANETTWYQCGNITAITLTAGNGYMDDYGYDENNSLHYTYTPWYISRAKLKTFSLDENVRAIGDYAFRACNVVTSLTLNNCEYIGKYAFQACPKLRNVTILTKQTEIAHYALFSYQDSGADCVYSFPVLIAYDDSTAHDYCTATGAKFASLGCGHSRRLTFTEDAPSCCFDTVRHYTCNDCGTQFDEDYVPINRGHAVFGTVSTLGSAPLAGATVVMDNETVAVTDENGAFAAFEIPCGSHTLAVQQHGETVAQTDLTVNGAACQCDLHLSYGDFNGDGYVNGRDYLRAKRAGWTDYRQLDYGKVKPTVCDVSDRDTPCLPQITAFRMYPHSTDNSKFVFAGVAENDSPFTVLRIGLVYGKNMPDSLLKAENEGVVNDDGYQVKVVAADDGEWQKSLSYGSSTKTGFISARFFIEYTNGTQNGYIYSEILSHIYEEAE